MLAMPTIAAPLVSSLPVLSYGFQYFQFNSALALKNFDASVTFSGAMNGTLASPAVQVNLRAYGSDPTINVTDTTSFGASGGWQNFSGAFNFNRDWSQGDIMFVVGSSYSTMQTEFQAIDIKVTSTEIKAYALKRVQYDYISGIPESSADFLHRQSCDHFDACCDMLPGHGSDSYLRYSNDGPGAPYNIEDVTPKHMLLNWGNYLRSILWDMPTGVFRILSTLDKNQFLITKKDAALTLVQRCRCKL